MKMAVNTPISAVTPKATVGNGEVSPKFCNGKNRIQGLAKELIKDKVAATVLIYSNDSGFTFTYL